MQFIFNPNVELQDNDSHNPTKEQRQISEHSYDAFARNFGADNFSSGSSSNQTSARAGFKTRRCFQRETDSQPNGIGRRCVGDAIRPLDLSPRSIEADQP
jgi:hypothetical protein